MKRCLIPYKEVEDHIYEGDVLLFRKRGGIGSWLIRSATDSLYSHAGLASWVYGEKGDKARLECVEFREWKGGRSVSLEKYIEIFDGEIDVFTPNRYHLKTIFDCQTKQRNPQKTFFRGRNITNELRSMTGMAYGWYRILWIIKNRLLWFWRNIKNYEDTKEDQHIYPICSTVIAYCYSKHFADLTHFKADSAIEPGDLARSPILNYVFTIQKKS